MKKFSLGFLLTLFPIFLYAADDSLSFSPPAGDYSVVFLGNIFGIVDGVIHGSGSQIMGAMFGVFNAAVLALGGIIIMYTMLVSTMNTAHEGQMLGQKWSSLWIPIRSTVGLALLVPKASGYCLMQIFVMWIVVQGVGAADKVWDAALGYLNRGGVIIQQQSNPTAGLTSSTVVGADIATGAQAILAGQVCMLGLQNQLQSLRDGYLQQKSGGQTGQSGASSGPLPGPAPSNQQSGGTPCDNPKIKPICDTPVPNFANTVNVVGVQSSNPTQSSFSVSMPNLDSNSPYAGLNGICGYILWNKFSFADAGSSDTNVQNVFSSNGTSTTGANVPGLNASDLSTAYMSRAIGIQQMYMDLLTVAQIMVNNDPQLNDQKQDSNSTPYSSIANEAFGYPVSTSGGTCSVSDNTCVLWAGNSGGGTLFSGTEFSGALSDYNGVMAPTLNIAQQSKNSAQAQSARTFISNASYQGWIMAGSYFFALVNLNQLATNTGGAAETNTGLDGSCMDPTVLSFSAQGSSCTGQSTAAGNYKNILSTWFMQDDTALKKVMYLIQGGASDVTTVSATNFSQRVTSPQGTANRSIYTDNRSSTVFGFTNNATLLILPNQPGQNTLQFANMLNMKLDTTPYQLPNQDFDCGKVKILFFSFCLGELMGNLFYNSIFRVVYNFFLDLFGTFINQVLNAFLMVPLQGMAFIFQDGLQLLNTPGVNPIVALAQMGTYYINFAGQVWLMLIEMSIMSVLIPVFGIFIFALIGLSMPLLLAWIGIMVTVGFSTAYYIPVLPYMIFTFGSIGWFIAVIEAMVAAPLVALGVTHPEGHDAFGKGEQAIMILMNVFLRPALMIIGYIAAIVLSYVGVWVINAGFDTAIGFIQGGVEYGTLTTGSNASWSNLGGITNTQFNIDANVPLTNIGYSTDSVTTPAGSISGGYTSWAGVFAFFFSILIYTTMYLSVVQRAFSLISYLPDRVLRWIGGQPESIGQEGEKWTDKAERQIGEAATETGRGKNAMDKQLSAQYEKGTGALKKSMGGASETPMQAKGNMGPNSTPGGGGGGDAGGGGGTPPAPPA